MKVFLLVLTALIAYALGALNGAIISSKYVWKRDIRELGSGNAGLTNFLRIFGASGVALVLAIDILKSVMAVLIGGWLMGFAGLAPVGKLYAGFCLMLGHNYPAYFNFRGGKGVLCGGVVALMADWRVGLICLLIFALIVVFTRYVSLGSMVAGLALPLMLLIFGSGGLVATLGLFCALLLVFRHRDNIGRLLSGTEGRLSVGQAGRRPDY